MLPAPADSNKYWLFGAKYALSARIPALREAQKPSRSPAARGAPPRMQDSDAESTPVLAEIPEPTGGVQGSAATVQFGIPRPAAQQILLYSADEWEQDRKSVV